MKKIGDKGSVIWITGLSGAGKSTLAAAITARLRGCGQSVVLLDGDELREVLGATSETQNNHGRDGRLALAMKYGRLCRVIASQGFTVVIATISLFHEVHAWNRENLPGYFEVYLRVPVEELRRRDPKGIYNRFDSGQISNVAGLDLPFDEPKYADRIVSFVQDMDVETTADDLIYLLTKRGS